MTDELRDLLRGAVSDVRVEPGSAAQAVAGARRATHRRRATAGLALAMAIAAAMAVVLLPDGADDRLVPAADAPRALRADDPASLVIRDGDRVTGSGRIVSIPGQPVEFCGREVRTLDLVVPAAPPVGCAFGLPVTGVDLGALSDHVEKAGAVEGFGTITGTFRAGSLAVTTQSPEQPPYPVENDEFGTTVPCAPPSGGWRDLSDDYAVVTGPVSAFRSGHPGVVQNFALARPRPGSTVVMVLTKDDAGRRQVEEAVSAAYDGNLCVQVAINPATTVDAARRAFSDDHLRLRAWGIGTTLDRDGQDRIDVDLLLVDQRALELARRFPAGLVTFRPSLYPAD